MDESAANDTPEPLLHETAQPMPAANGSDPSDPKYLDLEAFKDTLGKKLQDQMYKTQERSPWMYEVDQDVDLSDMSSDEADKVLFGRVFEVTDGWMENVDFDQEDEEAVKDELRDLLRGDFNDRLIAIADAQDQDPDELLEELLEDDDLSYSQLDLGLHSMNYRWRGRLAASAQLGDIRVSCDTSEVSDLFDTLFKLRIPLEAWLSACQKALDEAADNDELGEGELKAWGIENDIADAKAEAAESDPPIELQVSASKIYLDAMRQRHAQYEMECARSLRAFAEPPVVNPSELLDIVVNNQYNGNLTLHLHLTVDGSTVDGFSTQASVHDLAQRNGSDFEACVMSGYIAPDTYGGRSERYSADLKAPVQIYASLLGINKDACAERESDTIELAPGDRAYAQLYQAWYMKCRGHHHARANASDPIPEQVLDQLSDHYKSDLAALPWWEQNHAVSKFSSGAQHPQLRDLLENLVGKPDEQDLQEAARHCVRELQVYSVGQPDEAALRARSRIEYLVDLAGPERVNEAATGLQGCSAFDLACQRFMPLPLIDRLEPTCHHEDQRANALSRASHALSRTIYALSRKESHPVAEYGASVCQSLIERGLRLPFRFLNNRQDGPLHKMVVHQQTGLLAGMLSNAKQDKNPDEHAELCNSLLRLAATHNKVQSFACLLDCGADPVVAQIEQNLLFQRRSLEQMSWSRDVKEQAINDMEHIMRAHMAKKAAVDIINELTAGATRSLTP